MFEPFVVEAVDDNGSQVTLFRASSSAECRSFLDEYTRRLDDDGRAGGWSLIEVYDVRGENAERLWVWEAED